MTTSPAVLLCFDGSEGALRAIQDAGRLLGPRTAVVLTVWEAARDLTTLDPVGDAVGRLSGIYAELDAAGLQAARDVAQRGAALARDAGFEPRTRVECGAVWRTIVVVATQEDAAVIVIGARGLSGPAAVLGSVSARVSHHAGRPVLIVPELGDQPGGSESPSGVPRTA
ncbi:MAG: universal stress protein [Solirubrobacteraceae bacterium]